MMILDQGTIRNVVAGSVLAGGIAFGSVQLGAFQCQESVPQCAPETYIGGFGMGISCVCEGDGDCGVVTSGYAIQCACEGFPVTNCDCDAGCS